MRQERKGPGQRVQVASTARHANGLVSVDASLCQRSSARQYRGPDLKRPGVWAVAHENRAQLQIALADSQQPFDLIETDRQRTPPDHRDRGAEPEGHFHFGVVRNVPQLGCFLGLEETAGDVAAPECRRGGGHHDHAA